MKYDNEEDEGEQFDFDSGDEIPEADRQAAGADATSGSGGSPVAPSPRGAWPPRSDGRREWQAQAASRSGLLTSL